MRLVYAGRRKGKTTACIEAVRRTNGLLLVSSYRERDRIIKDFGKKDKSGVYHGIQPRQVITVQDLHSARFRGTKHAPRVIIDNLELVIEQLVGLHVDVVTTSVDPETVIGHQARVLAEGGVEEDTEGVVEVARALPVGEIIERKRQELFPGVANPERPQL